MSPDCDKSKYDTKYDHGCEVDTGKFCIDKKSHDHGTDQSDRCADAHAQDHLISHLNVGDICGQSCDKSCGAEFVNIGERECLDIFIHCLS